MKTSDAINSSAFDAVMRAEMSDGTREWNGHDGSDAYLGCKECIETAALPIIDHGIAARRQAAAKVRVALAVNTHADYIKAGRQKVLAIKALDGGAMKGPENDAFIKRVKSLREVGIDV